MISEQLPHLSPLEVADIIELRCEDDCSAFERTVLESHEVMETMSSAVQRDIEES